MAWSPSISADTAIANGCRTGLTRSPISAPTRPSSRGRSPASREERPVAVGASLGGIASLVALGGPGEPAFAGLVLVDIVPKMDARGRRPHPGLHAGESRRGIRLRRGGGGGGCGLSSAPAETNLARRSQEKPAAPLRWALALALGSALPRWSALGEYRLGDDRAVRSWPSPPICRCRRSSCAADRANSSRRRRRRSS